jgi:hypothetical protein
MIYWTLLLNIIGIMIWHRILLLLGLCNGRIGLRLGMLIGCIWRVHE